MHVFVVVDLDIVYLNGDLKLCERLTVLIIYAITGSYM